MFGSKSHTTTKLPKLSGENSEQKSAELHIHTQRATPYLVGRMERRRPVTAQQDEATFRAVFDTNPNPMGVVELINDSIVHRIDNAAAGQFFGHNPLWMRNKLATEIGISPDSARKWLRYYEQSAHTRSPQRFEYIHQTPTHRALLHVTVCYLNQSLSGWPQFSYLAEDITESRKAQDTLEGKARQYHELYAATQRREKELTLRDRIRTKIMQNAELSQIISTVVEGIADNFEYSHVSIYLLNDNVLELQQQVGYESAIPRLPITIGIMGQVASTGIGVLCEDVTTNPIFVTSLIGTVSKICVPLLDGEIVLGVLNVESTDGQSLGPDDFRSINALAESMTFALSRARLYDAMSHSQERFHTFLNNSPAVAFIKDAEGRYVYINTHHERIFSIRAEELIGKTDNVWLSPDVAAQVQENDRRVLTSGEMLEFVESITTPDGVLHHWLACKFPIKDASGRNMLGGVAIDISERKKAEDDLHQMAIRDELTGLYNRRELHRLLEEASDRYRNHGRSTALLMLDIDHFKLVNDTYGHKTGDKVLQWLSELLHVTVDSFHTLARYGGEELAIILPDTTNDEAVAIAEHIRREVEANPYKLTRNKGRVTNIKITVSLGIAVFSEAIDLEENLISSADTALYEAKRLGRNCSVLFDSALSTTTSYLTTSPLQLS